ncbi:hypothetical protein SNE40_022500 [Patella caerulea]|uniref:Integrin alpha-2 domain-containing protein n=1 Tax=Patella caerulea TaxID=87958 RepID=A0AAN8G0H9_PATCE
MGVKLFTNLSFIIVCIPSVCIWSVLSYNIDTEQARIFSGPKTSYFGYTTVLTRNQDGIRLLVGAPNDNTGSGVNRTGSVYICDTRDEGECTRFYNPGTGRTDSVHPSVYPITMEGFGSCLNQISNSKILMCAPRFKDLRFPTQAFVTGRCIITNTDLRSRVNSSLPVEDEGKYADRVLGYIQGMAESGFSCDTLMPGTYVLGAPGLNTWRGGFAVIEGGNYADSIVDIPRQKQNMNDNLGFAVVGGHFCSNNRMCFAAGAPRFKHMGRVMLFERSVGNEVIQLLELTCPDKDSMGSYFGSVLCSADVNGDGWDDLLVGAPFYTKVDPDSEESSFPKDEGRVWIFISQKKELQDKSYFQDTPIMLSGSNTAFSRFGSSISNLGDVNGDGIDDIAVGAKDENGVGAVYIYHGSADGQIVEYSQRITGEMVSENITGFGAHVSKPLDVDDNGYPDMAIGCTNSDKAVLLRTRPIIDLVADLNFDSELINLNRTNCPAKDDAESCIVLILCFNYSQRSAPKQIEMDFNISVDILKRPSLRRVKIHTEDGFLDQISDKVLVERGRNKCKRFDLITLMEERLQDPFTAVRVQAQFKLNDSRFDPGEIKPIINQTRPSVLTKDTRFQLSCGEDNICEANLGIKGEFSFSDGDVFITINQTENINLDVRLENYGENSFGSKVNFYWNENLFYRTVKSSPRWPIGCADKSDEGQNYKLTCTVFPPINRNQAVNFSVLLEGDALSLNNAKVDVSIQAQTASAENNMENNVANFSSDVWIVASPDISGKSYPPELSVNTEEDTSLQNLTIIHKYLMINNGPSFLPATNVTVHLPYLYKTGEQLVESAIAKVRT